MYNIWGKIKYVDDKNVCQGYATGGWYIPYFKQIDSSSSTSRWSKMPYDIDPENEGYYSFDLEDYYILTSEGSYRKGTDRIYLPFFWNKNDNSDINLGSVGLTHIGFIDHIIRAGEEDAEINMSLVPVKSPTVTYTFPAVNVNTNTDIKMSETSSLPDYTVTPDGCGKKFTTELKQLSKYNGLDIFKNFKLKQTVYSWGDNSEIIVDKTGNGSTSSLHKYTKPGMYTIKTTVKTGLDASYDSKELQIMVAYNVPIVDFSINSEFNFKGNEKVTFVNLTKNNPDNRESLYTYTWEISDTTLTGTDSSVKHLNKQYDFIPEYNFKSPGTKTIKLTCNWNDGFENKTVVKSKNITISRFNVPTLSFNITSDIEIKGNNLIKYHNTTKKDIDDKRNLEYLYTWTMFDKTLASEESNYVVTLVNINEIPTYTYKSPGSKTVKLVCSFNDGFEEKTAEFTKTFILNEFDIVPNFNWDFICKNRNEQVSFSNSTTGDISKIRSYLWNVEDSWEKTTDILYTFLNTEESKFGEGSLDNTKKIVNNKTYTTEHIKTNFHSEIEKNIQLTIKYFTGWEEKQKNILKIYKPSHLTTSSTLNASNKTPVGRKEEVTFTNKYNDPNDLQYYYDLKIDDFYSICNIDNSSNIILNNNKEYLKVNIKSAIKHKFQNTENNNVLMRVYYDNGWGRTYIDYTNVIKPIVFTSPIIDFDWDKSVISNRNIDVIFKDISKDVNSLIIRASWIINDSFDLYNPDNINYGIEETDNTSRHIDVNKSYKPTHKFQSNKKHNIEYSVIYDDGFCERELKKVKVLETIDNIVVVPMFSVYQNSILVDTFIPKISFNVVNSTEYSNIVETKFTLNDIDALSNKDNFVELIGNNVEHIWKYATRKPKCIDSGFVELMKSIKMNIRYDNGWTDNNNVNLEKKYKADTNEVNDLSIKYLNKDWDNSLDIYGKETVEFYSEFKELYDYENIIEWFIEDSVYDDIVLDYNFKSSGNKEVKLTLSFDDGYDNIYYVNSSINLEIKTYLQPDLDFVWEGSDISIGDKVSFRSTNLNVNRPYSKINSIKIDYYNDGVFDEFDIDGDGIVEAEEYEVNKQWWNIFEDRALEFDIKLVGYWNDGFEDRVVEVVRSIVLLDVPPNISLEVINISNNKYKMTISTDNGVDLLYKFDLYIKTPIVEIDECRDISDIGSSLPVCSSISDFGTEYYKIYETIWDYDNERWISVATGGKYKVIGYVKNNSGEVSAEKYFDIEIKAGNPTYINCSRQCITGIIKKYKYKTSGENVW